jgi:hypothetical protein
VEALSVVKRYYKILTLNAPLAVNVRYEDFKLTYFSCKYFTAASALSGCAVRAGSTHWSYTASVLVHVSLQPGPTLAAHSPFRKRLFKSLTPFPLQV